MDDPKNFLTQTILNGPIRKVMLKVKFEDLRIFFYYQVNLARHLEKFSQKFFVEKGEERILLTAVSFSVQSLKLQRTLKPLVCSIGQVCSSDIKLVD